MAAEFECCCFPLSMSHCLENVQMRGFFWFVFFRIRTECGDLLRNPPYSVRIQEIMDQKKLRIWALFTQ